MGCEWFNKYLLIIYNKLLSYVFQRSTRMRRATSRMKRKPIELPKAIVEICMSRSKLWLNLTHSCSNDCWMKSGSEKVIKTLGLKFFIRYKLYIKGKNFFRANTALTRGIKSSQIMASGFLAKNSANQYVIIIFVSGLVSWFVYENPTKTIFSQYVFI